MIKYADFQPSGFDPKGLNLPERQDWLVAPCATNRDAPVLTQANWEAMLEILAKHCEEDWEKHSFGHWACGWFEIALVKPESAAAIEMAEVEAGLADYPVVSDNKLSDLECQECGELWKTLRLKEKIELCNQAKVSIMAARRDSFPSECYELLRDMLD